MSVSDAERAAAAGVIEDIFGVPVEAQQDDPDVSVQPTPETPQESQPEPDPEDQFVIAGRVSDEDMEELGLNDPDDEDETPTPVAQDDEDYEYEDQEQLRRQLAKTKKELDFQKELRAKENKGKWEKEAKRRFPYASVENLSATSKRAFMKSAALSHNSNYEILEPHLTALAKAREGLAPQAKADARAETAAAWGRPTSGPGVSAQEAAEASDKIAKARERARRTGDFTNVFKEMFKSGQDPFS